jgi:integrase/recombinase XerD
MESGIAIRTQTEITGMAGSLSLDNLGSYEQEIKIYMDTYGLDFSFQNIKTFILSAGAPETRNKRVKAFKRFYRNNIENSFLLKNKIDEISTLSVKIEIEPVSIHLSKTDCLAVIEYLRSKPVKLSKHYDPQKNVKLALIIKTLYSTGLRIAELIGIHRGQIKLNGCAKIQVIGKGSKTRTVKIPIDLYNEIVSVFGNESEYLFSVKKQNREKESKSGNAGKLNQANLFKAIRKAYEGIGVKSIGLHTHRHLFATELVKQGVPINEVSKLLGHSSVDITAKYYLHNQTEPDELWKKLGI